MPLFEKVIQPYVNYCPKYPCESTTDGVGKLRHSHVDSMIGVLKQLEHLALYATDVFESVMDEAKTTNEHLTRVGYRIQHLTLTFEGTLNSESEKQDPLPQRAENPSKEALTQRHVMSRALKEQYEQCQTSPDLAQLDAFTTNAGACMKKYSDPSFFIKAWLEAEHARQALALVDKKARKARRKARRAAQAHKVLAEEERPKVTMVSEQRMRKLLSIRSWKDLYGTGEGKELAKPRRRSWMGGPGISILNSIGLPNQEEQEALGSPPPPPPPEEEEEENQEESPGSSSSEAGSTPPPPPESPECSSPLQVQDHVEPLQPQEYLPISPPPPPPLEEEEGREEETRSTSVSLSDLMSQIQSRKQVLRPVVDTTRISSPNRRKSTPRRGCGIFESAVITEILARRSAIAHEDSDADSSSSDDDWS